MFLNELLACLDLLEVDEQLAVSTWSQRISVKKLHEVACGIEGECILNKDEQRSGFGYHVAFTMLHLAATSPRDFLSFHVFT